MKTAHQQALVLIKKMGGTLSATLGFSILFAIGGCASITPNFDANFGKSLVAIREAQTRNPAASIANKDKSIDGIEGRVARESIQRYHQSFVEPPAPVNVFNIGVGGGWN